MEQNNKPAEYISFNTVLNMYGIVKYVPAIPSFATDDSSKKSDTSAIYHYMPPEFMFGYNPRKIKGSEVNIAEPEKAFLDLILLALTGRATIELAEMDLSSLCNADSLNRLDDYSRRMGINYKKFIKQEAAKASKTQFDYDIPDELAA